VNRTPKEKYLQGFVGYLALSTILLGLAVGGRLETTAQIYVVVVAWSAATVAVLGWWIHMRRTVKRAKDSN
jgi:hypothetical protein